jgi:nitroreductase
MNPFIELIERRRSIRAYTNEDVTPEDIRQILEAAMAAPSGNNLKPWEFVVVRDKQLRGELAKTHKWSYMCGHAPVVVVVLGNSGLSDHWIEDTSAATENMLLAVTALNLGAVWIAVHPRSQRCEHVKKVLNLPAHLNVLSMVAVGHPAEEKPPRTQYDESKVHYDAY